MSIKSIILNNFKSYKYQNITDFNDRVNVIVGKNGHGKSNLFNSISFIFSDMMRKEEKQHILHQGVEQEVEKQEDISVEMILDNKKRFFPLQQDTIQLKRVWTENKDDFYLNDRSITQNQLNNILDVAGITRQNPYNIVQQGKIQQITNMSEEGIKELLEEITGVKQYIRKKQNASKNLEEMVRDTEEVQNILEEIENKIKELQNQKKDYDQFHEQEIKAKCLNYCLQKKHQEVQEEKLKNIDRKIQECEQRISQIDAENEENFSDNSSIININSKKQELNQLLIQQQQYKNEMKRNELMLSEALLLQEDLQAPVIQPQTLAQIDGKLREVSSLLNNNEKQLQEINQIYSEISSNQQSFMLQQDIQDVDKIKGKIIEKIEKLKQAIEEINQKVSSLESQRAEQEAKKRQMVDSIDKPQIKTENDYNQIIQEIKQKINNVRLKNVELVKDRNRKKLEIQQKEMNNIDLQKKLQSLLKDQVLTTVEKIKRIAEERNISGIYGLLIDYIDTSDINFFQKLSYFYDTAAKNSLFSLIVEDDEAVKQVLSINKEIKGASIGIYSLSQIREQEYEENLKYPSDSSSIFILNQYIFSDQSFMHYQEIQNLLKKIFSKYILVKSYDLALQYSKENKLNCMTDDHDLVYSEGFLTRVGGKKHQSQDKLLLYIQYKRNKLDIQKLQLSLSQTETDKKNLDENENNLKVQQNKLIEDFNNIQYAGLKYQQHLQEIENQNSLLEENLKKLRALHVQINNNIQKYNNELKNLNSLKHSEGNLNKENNTKINQNFQEMEKYKKKLQDLLDKQQQLEEQKKDLQREKDKFTNLGLQKHQNKHQQIQIIKEEIKENKELMKMKSQEIEQVLQELEGLTKVRLTQMSQQQRDELEDLQKSLESFLLKKQDILIAKSEYDEQLEKNQNVYAYNLEQIQEYSQLREKEIIAMLKEFTVNYARKYTAKDKVLFGELNNLQNKYKEKKQAFNEIQDNKKTLLEFIDKTEEKCEEIIKDMFEKFSGYFQDYFSQIVPGGQSECRLIRQKKQGDGISIRVHFTNEEDVNKQDHSRQKENSEVKDSKSKRKEDIKPMENWKQLSAGQRCVISMAIILSLQRCDPSPFYVFDEIDSALDQNYIERILKLIHHNSRNAQYFLTSFKTQVLQIPEATYFQVEYEDRQSKVREISRNEAEQVLLNEN